MSQVKFLHYRVVKDGQVEGKGGATLVFVTGEEGVSFAEAYCSHKDNYNRRLGRDIALGRLAAGVVDEFDGTQEEFLEAMDSEQATPSLSQAQRLKKFSQQKMLSLDVMRAVMSEEKKTDLDRVTLKNETLRRYFPKSYTPKQMEDTIIKLLEGWYKKRQLSQER